MRRHKSLSGFKFGTVIGRFPSDGAASMAVKGLILLSLHKELRKTKAPHVLRDS